MENTVPAVLPDLGIEQTTFQMHTQQDQTRAPAVSDILLLRDGIQTLVQKKVPKKSEPSLGPSPKECCVDYCTWAQDAASTKAQKEIGTSVA